VNKKLTTLATVYLTFAHQQTGDVTHVQFETNRGIN